MGKESGTQEKVRTPTSTPRGPNTSVSVKKKLVELQTSKEFIPVVKRLMPPENPKRPTKQEN